MIEKTERISVESQRPKRGGEAERERRQAES